MADKNEQEQNAQLARIDERTLATQSSVARLERKFEDYVTRHEFTPVKLIVFGLAAIILTSVVAAIIAKVIQ